MTTQINLRTLAAVSLVASNEETRYYLNGVLIEARADSVTYVATDGHRLIAVRDDLAKDAPRNDVIGAWIVPADTCRALKPKKSKYTFDTAELTLEGENLRFQGVSGISVFKPIDGSFPDWRRVINSSLSGRMDFKGKNDKETQGITFNFDYLADFAKFARMMGIYAYPHLAPNDSGPVGVIFGDADHILAALMPVRGSSQSALQAMWETRVARVRDLLPQSEAAPIAA